MTWLSTWLDAGSRPAFAEHATETAAMEHARAMGGVAFWSEVTAGIPLIEDSREIA